MSLTAPFPYFGGKRRAAPLIWERLGDPSNYIEPFVGSAAVLLARPATHKGTIETINDVDGLLVNFWRAMTSAPDEVAHHADWPVTELDLVARQNWLHGARESITAALKADPLWHDARAAGWWVWGAGAWIGGGYCERELGAALPVIDGWKNGAGIHQGKLPRIAGHDGGTGVHAIAGAKLPMIAGHVGGRGIHGDAGRRAVIMRLADRLSRVRVCCGDWQRVLSRSALMAHRVASVGIVLDPPYDDGAKVYAHNERLSSTVREWALEQGTNKTVRIALCGYEGEHDALEAHGWTVEAWKADGGYASQASQDAASKANSSRERIWFSPHCLRTAQASLF